MKTYFLLSLNLIICVIASSCAGEPRATLLAKDPRYDSLKSNANPNPTPNAIVGMWYGELGSVANNATSTSTLLIRSNGTMVTRAKSKSDDTAAPGNYTWKYAGNGCWNVQPADDSLDSILTDTLQISGKCLIRHVHVAQWNGADMYFVYVRADDDDAVSKERSRHKE